MYLFMLLAYTSDIRIKIFVNLYTIYKSSHQHINSFLHSIHTLFSVFPQNLIKNQQNSIINHSLCTGYPHFVYK